MPFTPFHIGPALFFGLLLFSLLDLPTFLLASVIVDIRAIFVYFGIIHGPLHGPLHTFLGGTIIAVLLATAMFLIKDYTKKITKLFKLQQNSSFKKTLITSLLGVYLHIFLDSPLYLDIKPFYPLDINPLYGIVSSPAIYLFCVFSFILASLIYIYNIYRLVLSN